MFTGLIEDVGELAARTPQGKAAKLEIRTALPIADIEVGESIAVNGACLTVEQVQAEAGTLVFHSLRETLRRTNLATVAVGSPVNLERAMRLGDRLGGHLVLGHVDATASIAAVERLEDDYVVTIGLPEELHPLVIPKGSIAVDGISLTIAHLADDAFTVHIIPHTWDATNLQAAKPNSVVNLEADMVGKYILRSQQAPGGPGGVSMQDLQNAGFE